MSRYTLDDEDAPVPQRFASLLWRGGRIKFRMLEHPKPVFQQGAQELGAGHSEFVTPLLHQLEHIFVERYGPRDCLGAPVLLFFHKVAACERSRLRFVESMLLFEEERIQHYGLMENHSFACADVALPR
jgi:hypothetical protein